MVCTVVLINRLVFHSLAASMFFVMQTIRKYLISMVGRGSSRSWRGFDFSDRKERQRRIQGGGEVGEEGRVRQGAAVRGHWSPAWGAPLLGRIWREWVKLKSTSEQGTVVEVRRSKLTRCTCTSRQRRWSKPTRCARNYHTSCLIDPPVRVPLANSPC